MGLPNLNCTERLVVEMPHGTKGLQKSVLHEALLQGFVGILCVIFLQQTSVPHFADLPTALPI
jgi:hypothetical protein